VISGKRVLGNAHGVAFHSVIRIRKYGGSRKYIARVLHVGHECDLALLTVDDADFWTDLAPLRFGGVPQLQDKINVVGYPTGGDNISVTQGIVSRVGVGKYSHSDEALLTVQIDAAINSGNSGGPAVKRSQVVGVAFETLNDAENIGYIIPTPVIEHFLKDIERNGKYLGFCSLGVHWQRIENKGMRLLLKLESRGLQGFSGSKSVESEKSQGILVRKVEPLTETFKALKPNDVLMAFDGHPIASDGTISFRGSERVLFSYLVTSKYVGESVELTFVRDGKFKRSKVTLRPMKQLVRVHM